ncbi:MAG: DUF3015 family protein [Nitrospiraceae bacterium]
MSATMSILRIAVAAMLLLGMVGCSVTGTTKDFLSSTSPGDWYNEDGLPKAEYKVQAFVALNLVNLRTDVARGHGEYLTSLGALLAVPPQHETEFFALAQHQYSSLARADATAVSQTLIAFSQNLRPVLSPSE